MEKYKNKSVPVEERIQDLLSRMTLQEKIGQLNQRMLGWDAYEKEEQGEGFRLTQRFREEVAFGDGLGALYGLFRADPWSKVTFENGIPPLESAKVANQIQRYVIENTRLGIPVLLSEEGPHGHQALGSTILPTNIGVGSSWNPELCKEAFSCVAAEIRARGGHIGLVSVLDMLRDPRWGRSEECFGEDPYLGGRFTDAIVRGLQGDSPEQLAGPDKVVACLKHLAAQGAAVGGHNAWPATIGERELRDMHLAGVKGGVEAGALACMAAYNEVDGIPCHANGHLLTGILRDELGFQGIVMSDGCGVDSLIPQAGSPEAAAAMALNAGVDLNLWNQAFLEVAKAMEGGLIREEIIDRAVSRVLRLKFQLGLFENPYVEESFAAGVLGRRETSAINRQLAQESVVLLKNENDVLPISTKMRRIAVIGPNADNMYNQLGDYTPTQPAGKGTTVLQGIRQLLREVASDTEVAYVRGCGIRDASKAEFDAAVQAAHDADVAVLVMGGSSARDFNFRFADNGAAIADNDSPSEMDCGEGIDVAELELGGVQTELAKAVYATGKPIVVVLIQGRPHAIPWIKEHAHAVLTAWYPGEEGGIALAELLFGLANPSGKLSVSIPASSAQLPVSYNLKASNHSSAYVDASNQPLYPFGHGLSYTTFLYEDFTMSTDRVSGKQLALGETVKVSVKVKNNGRMAGKEVVQLYISDRVSSITPRNSELKAFRKLELQPGQSETIVFELGLEALSQWNSTMCYTPDPGRLRVRIGHEKTSELSAVLFIEP